MRSVTCNGNALFAENKSYELYNISNENKGLICGGLICGEILNSTCLDFFWTSLFEGVFVLNFTFAIFCYHGATVTLRFHDLVLIFSYISYFQKVLPSLQRFLCLSLFFLGGSPAFCEFPLSPKKVGLTTHWSRLLY